MNIRDIQNEIKLIRAHLSKLEKFLQDEQPEPKRQTDPCRAEAIRVMELMNEILGSNFVVDADGHLKHIIARLHQGRTFADFEAVIRDRKREWKNDPKMSVYLRPSTLFGSKFDGYLSVAKRRETAKSYNDDAVHAALMMQFMEENVC